MNNRYPENEEAEVLIRRRLILFMLFPLTILLINNFWTFNYLVKERDALDAENKSLKDSIITSRSVIDTSAEYNFSNSDEALVQEKEVFGGEKPQVVYIDTCNSVSAMIMQDSSGLLDSFRLLVNSLTDSIKVLYTEIHKGRRIKLSIEKEKETIIDTIRLRCSEYRYIKYFLVSEDGSWDYERKKYESRDCIESSIVKTDIGDLYIKVNFTPCCDTTEQIQVNYEYSLKLKNTVRPYSREVNLKLLFVFDP